MGLCTLLDTHFQIDTVTHDVHLGRLQLIEQITVVPIVVTDGIFILLQSFVHQLLVVDVTFLHTQCSVQVVSGNYGVAHPCDVTDVVLLTLVNLHIDIDMLVVNGPYGVFQNGGITITQLVIFLDEQ